MEQFNVGDKVICTKAVDDNQYIVNVKGVVRNFDHNRVLVQFDSSINIHGSSGGIANGWYCNYDALRIAFDDKYALSKLTEILWKKEGEKVAES